MTDNPAQFDYNTAFSRNIGWLTQWEQQRIRSAKIAVAGAGGVGGIHLQTLARLGFSRFHVADLDHFELANFNRQAGARMETLGAPKAQVASDMVKAINPEAEVEVFAGGVSEANLEAFLEGVDVYIDGLDFFVLDLRAKLFRLARKRGVTTITAAPIGMGVGYLIFTPDSMSFDDFFALGQDADSLDGAAGFLIGLTPAMLQRPYLADPSQVDLAGQRGPSTAIACQLCAGVAAAEAVKVVLRRGPTKPAPYYHQFDAYLGRYVSRKLAGGAANPLQRVKRSLVKALTGGFSEKARPKEVDASLNDTVLERILEAGRWAPSADNTQPWRFVLRGDDRFDIQLRYDESHIYEYRKGQPARLACGMLLENLTLRAARFGYALEWEVTHEAGGEADIACVLTEDASVSLDPLECMIEPRCTTRGWLSRKPVDESVLARLEAAVGADYQLTWHQGFADRLRESTLSARAAIVRLGTQETIPVHQSVVRFDSPFPRWGLPSRGLGLSGFAHALMKFAFGSVSHARWLLGRLGGAFYGALEMDLLPGIMSGAHFTLMDKDAKDEAGLQSDLQRGRAIQRLWLACTLEGLGFQPACAPIWLHDYGSRAVPFSQSQRTLRAAKVFAERADEHFEGHAGQVVFRGRIGCASQKGGQPRSLRQPLSDLIVEANAQRPEETAGPQSPIAQMM